MKISKIVTIFCITATIIIGGFTAVAAETMTAEKVLANVVSALQNSPAVNFAITCRSGNTSFNADLTMAREKFAYQAGTLRVFYDGSTQWTVDTDAKEVSVTTPTAEEIAETNPLSFINSYKKNYTSTLVSSANGTYTVKMTANKKSSYIRSAQIVVNSSTWMPVGITAQLSSGQTLNIRVNSARQLSAQPLGTFRYDAKSYPGYELIDLR